MKNTMKLFILLACMMAAMSLSAQKPVKLGHIETDKLLQAMPEVAAANEKLKAKEAEAVKEMTSLQEQFQAKMKEYTDNNKNYSEIIRQSKEQELNELNQRIQNFREVATNDLQRSQQDLMQPIMDKALKAIKDVGKEKGFTYIFDVAQGGLLYVSEDSEDILPLVKAKLGLK